MVLDKSYRDASAAVVDDNMTAVADSVVDYGNVVASMAEAARVLAVHEVMELDIEVSIVDCWVAVVGNE
mgnify:CR=1 FL=1